MKLIGSSFGRWLNMVSFWLNHYNFLKESTCAFKHTIQMEYWLWQSFVPFGAQIIGWLAWLGGKKFGELIEEGH